MTKATGTVLIESDYGEVNQYKLASARHAQFIKDFPPTEYSVLVSSEPMLSKDDHKLIRLAIEKDFDLMTLGFSQYKVNAERITASLVDSAGRTIYQASSIQHIQGPKDYEIGQTSAINRLLVVAGRHGSIMDEDEESTVESMGKSITHSDAATAQPAEEKSGASEQLIRQIGRLKNALVKSGADIPDHEEPTTDEEAIAVVSMLQAAKKAAKDAAADTTK